MTQSTAHYIRVLEGEGAFIAVGQEVPFTRDLAVVAGKYNAYARSVEYKTVTTGFWVRPQMAGDKVLLDIAPQLMSVGGQREERIDFQKLHSRVLVEPGQWVDLAGQMQNSDELSAAIFRLNADSGSYNFV